MPLSPFFVEAPSVNNHTNESHVTYSFKNFLPLIMLMSIIAAYTIARQIMYGLSLESAMYDSMGSFFIIFSLFKIINLAGFAQAYSMYDIIAQRYYAYGYIYPFIELALGILYVTRSHLMLANIATVIVMAVSSIGVFQALMRKQTFTCACLGTLFKLPMTYVTLVEDLAMGAMALIMLIM
jgi:hypothetical protein